MGITHIVCFKFKAGVRTEVINEVYMGVMLLLLR